MNVFDGPPARDRAAIVLSIAAHGCALWLLAIIAGTWHPAFPNADESAGPFRVTTIVKREHVTHRPIAATITRPGGQPRRFARSRLSSPPPPRLYSRISRGRPPAHAPAHVAQSLSPAGHARTGAVQAAGSRTSPRFTTVMPAKTVVATLSLPGATPTPAPPPATPTPEPTPRASVSPVTVTFGGLFSQDYPPAIAQPSELNAIRARLGGHNRIFVDVDESGHATDVRFVDTVADTDLTREIRIALLALRYVPADCNGLHCEGTLELRY